MARTIGAAISAVNIVACLVRGAVCAYSVGMTKHGKPLAYDLAQWQAIERWRQAQPDWGTRTMRTPSRIAAFAAQKIVPAGVLRGVLRGVDHAAGWTAVRQDVLKAAGVEQLDDLRRAPLEECDRLAQRVEVRAMALGIGGGALFGLAGAPGIAADIPTLLALALRTIHRTAYCYGEDWRAPERRGLAIGVFALASANTLEEKQTAWAAWCESGDLFAEAWRDGVERVAERHLAKGAAQFSIKSLADRIGFNIARRSVFGLGLVPVIGAVIGGAVNAGYLQDIAAVAQRALQYRCLSARYPALLASG
ncbi:EcsC family protein [Solimonas terrae]|uniref:EcsC family protein n=1 Tax=Solimonas terrae TaxID=1396819 RepID=A0A6M2BQ82_9GAMM|nr:EcsC family protein [Solimonas terrae]NGY04772.1 EcsC family protein [Solimonas terrae]